MSVERLLASGVLPLGWFLVTVAQEAATKAASQSSAAAKHVTNATGANSTKASLPGMLNSMVIQRALYVLIGITAVGVLYFLVRAVRLKRPNQRKKYGLLENYNDNVEMDAMESDEDETVYEARSMKR